MGKAKAQVSVELMVIISFVVLLFIPLVLFVYHKTTELSAGIEGMESRLLSSKLAFIANSLGSMGDQNSLKIEVTLPQTVRQLSFSKLGNGGEALITMKDGNQISQITIFPFESNRNYSGGASYKFEFVSQNGTIQVSTSS